MTNDHSAPLQTNNTIFVSYSRADAEFARRVYDQLAKLGFTMWRDLHDMEPGRDWWQQIEEAIRNCDSMVLCISPTSLASKTVTKEWQYARQQGKRVVPVVAADFDWKTVPYWLSKTDCPDFRRSQKFDPATAAPLPDHDLTWNRVVNTLNTPYSLPRLPFTALDLPDYFVERSAELDRIKHLLLEQGRGAPVAVTTALHGGGGFGKTTIALAMCHDEDIRAAFADGVLWIVIGQKPDLLGLMLDQIELLSGQRAGFTDIHAATGRFKELIAERDILIVLDDVWDEVHARPFLEGGPRCARVITTRLQDVIARTKAIEVGVNEMTSDEAVGMMLDWINMPTARPEPFVELADRLGRWPLLLKIVGGHMRNDVVFDGIPVERALERVWKRLDQHGITAFDLSSEADRNNAVGRSLGLSLDILGRWKVRCMELAVFAEDSDIPFSSAYALWKGTAGLDGLDAEDALLAIKRLELLEMYDDHQGAFRLHDVIREYLAVQVNDLPGLNAALLAGWGNPHQLPDIYAWNHYALHAAQANRTTDLSRLLCDFAWIKARLDATDVNALLTDYSYVAGEDALRQIEGAIRLSAHVVSVDKDQMGRQLYGRLGSLPNLPDTIQNMLMTIHSTELLEPLQPNLIPPGGYLLRILAGHTSWVNGALVLPDGRLLSWAEDHTLRIWSSGGQSLAVLEGHTKRVIGALALPDGRLLSWAEDHTLRIWSSEGQSLAVLKGHKSAVTGALVLPDGRLLSWGGGYGTRDTTLRMWSSEGNLVAVLKGHRDTVTGVLALPDGRLLSWEKDNMLRMWSTEGHFLTMLKGHNGAVTGALVLPDGRLLSWAEDHTLRIWSSEGQSLAVLKGHKSAVNGALVLPDGRLLSWADDNILLIWSSEGRPLFELKGHKGGVTGALVLPDGRLLSWARDRVLRIWSSEGKPLAVLKGHRGMVTRALVLPDGRLLSWAGDIPSFDHTLRLWSNKGQPLTVLKGHMAWRTGALALSDGRLLSWARDKTLLMWSSEGQSMAILNRHAGRVTGALALPDGRLLSWADDHTLRLWSSEGKPLAILKGHRSRVTGALVLPDGHLLSWARGYWTSATMQMWSSDGQPLTVLEGHTDSVNGALVLPNGRLLSWANDLTLRMWSSEGQPLTVLKGHIDSVNGVLVLPDGRLLSWTGRRAQDTTLRLWSSEGILVAVLKGHKGTVNGALALPDGRLLSWSDDGTLRLWSGDGQFLAALEEHTGAVSGALALPDGWLLSWAGDSTLRLWSGEGQPLTVLEGHTGSVSGALALPDGRLLSWSDDGTLRLWSGKGQPLDILRGHTRRVSGALVLPDGRLLSWADDGTLRVRSGEGQLLDVYYADGPFTCCVAMAGSDVLAAGDQLGYVHFVRLT